MDIGGKKTHFQSVIYYNYNLNFQPCSDRGGLIEAAVQRGARSGQRLLPAELRRPHRRDPALPRLHPLGRPARAKVRDAINSYIDVNNN